MLYVPPDLEEEARRLVKNAKTVEELLEEMSQASLEHLAEQKAKRSAGRTTRP
jgi:DNA-dependent RNA polymerase auxiliary subunit epsilon